MALSDIVITTAADYSRRADGLYVTIGNTLTGNIKMALLLAGLAAAPAVEAARC
jgi:hypothetical protein